MPTQKSKTVLTSMRIPRALHEKISSYAETNELTITQAVIDLIQFALEEKGAMIKIPRASMNELVDHIDDMFEQSLDEIFEIMETMPHVDYSKLKQAKEKYLNE